MIIVLEGKAALHAELDELGVVDSVAMIVHALIEIGQVREIQCSYDLCPFPTRAFVPGTPRQRRAPDVLSVDHIVEQRFGGTHMPTNLQLLHYHCNCLKGGKAGWTEENRAAHSARLSKRWEDPAYRQRITESSRSPEALAKRSISMRAAQARRTPEERSAIANAAWITRRAKEVVPS